MSPVATQVLVAIFSAGTLAILVRWRPEATSSAVRASEDVVALLRGELDRLKGEVGLLRDQVAELGDRLLAAEREIGQWRTKYETERGAHARTREQLAAHIRDCRCDKPTR